MNVLKITRARLAVCAAASANKHVELQSTRGAQSFLGLPMIHHVPTSAAPVAVLQSAVERLRSADQKAVA